MNCTKTNLNIRTFGGDIVLKFYQMTLLSFKKIDICLKDNHQMNSQLYFPTNSADMMNREFRRENIPSSSDG